MKTLKLICLVFVIMRFGTLQLAVDFINTLSKEQQSTVRIIVIEQKQSMIPFQNWAVIYDK